MKKLFIILTLVLFLSACKKEEEVTLEYDDFMEITRWSDIGMQEQGLWFIYVYSEFCYACESIKEDILSFGDYINEQMPFYLVNHGTVSGLAPIDYEGVPALFMLDEGEVISFFVGTSEIRNFITTFRP